MNRLPCLTFFRLGPLQSSRPPSWVADFFTQNVHNVRCLDSEANPVVRQLKHRQSLCEKGDWTSKITAPVPFFAQALSTMPSPI
jgi:hypothetical protein